ncbi:MAG: hypothetical protein BME93_02750 [Methanosarcinales archaeon Met12]|nr:MAG: hypothetical protein BME93_02750 [Methanosarcinales archaeon Met12]
MLSKTTCLLRTADGIAGRKDRRCWQREACAGIEKTESGVISPLSRYNLALRPLPCFCEGRSSLHKNP